MHPNVYCSPIYNSQDMEATKLSTNRGMDKEDVCLCIYMLHTMEYSSAIKKNKTVPFAETWIDPETSIQSGTSQKKKNKHRILTHICGI